MIPQEQLVAVLDSPADPDIEFARPVRDLLETEIRAHFHNLTCRQREVLKLVIEGRPTKDVALALGISPRTVEVHRMRILRKTLKANFLEVSRALHELSRSGRSE